MNWGPIFSFQKSYSVEWKCQTRDTFHWSRQGCQSTKEKGEHSYFFEFVLFISWRVPVPSAFAHMWRVFCLLLSLGCAPWRSSTVFSFWGWVSKLHIYPHVGSVTCPRIDTRVWDTIAVQMDIPPQTPCPQGTRTSCAMCSGINPSKTLAPWSSSCESWNCSSSCEECNEYWTMEFHSI
jgi:hypothetical protein